MEQKTEELLRQVRLIMGDDTDFLIIAHKDGHCCAMAKGEADNIAESIYACINQPNHPISSKLTEIIELVVSNLDSDCSPFKEHIINSIKQIYPYYEQ